MPDSGDALLNAVYGGIKRGIEVALEHETYGAAVVLIYSGLDAMANLGRPNGQAEVFHEDAKPGDLSLQFPIRWRSSVNQFSTRMNRLSPPESTVGIEWVYKPYTPEYLRRPT